MFISFFPFLFLFFIYLLMIVRINITFYLDSYLSILLCFSAIELTGFAVRCRRFLVKPEEKWKNMFQCQNRSEKCLIKFTFLLVWYSCKFLGTFFRH